MRGEKIIQGKLDIGCCEEDKFFIAFSHLINISPMFKFRLLEFFDFDPQRAWNCDKNDLKTLANAYPELTIARNFIDLRNEISPDELVSQANFITINSPQYPEFLRNIPDPPILLYYKGEISEGIFENTLAVVGSRKASDGAKIALAQIINDLGDSPVTIVSGLALGIDAQAHKSAIKTGLKTIGVIGCGINKVYPQTNLELYKNIENGAGLILSEYPPDVPPMPHHFPQRNRIVTGLSEGTLVAEAALRSGALISGNLALEQGRELMCIPGLISNPNTQGVYKLLKDGATLITCAKDILETLNWGFEALSPKTLKLDGIEKNIFDIISLESATIERIQAECAVDITRLMITLTQLELRGLIKQINGRYYISEK